MKNHNLFRSIAWIIPFSLVILSCSKNSDDISNKTIEELIVGSWNVTDYRVIKDGKISVPPHFNLECFSKRVNIFKENSGFDQSNGHTWNAVINECIPDDEGEIIETGTWRVIENRRVETDFIFLNGEEGFWNFEPTFVNENKFMWTWYDPVAEADIEYDFTRN